MKRAGSSAEAEQDMRKSGRDRLILHNKHSHGVKFRMFSRGVHQANYGKLFDMICPRISPSAISRLCIPGTGVQLNLAAGGEEPVTMWVVARLGVSPPMDSVGPDGCHWNKEVVFVALVRPRTVSSIDAWVTFLILYDNYFIAMSFCWSHRKRLVSKSLSDPGPWRAGRSSALTPNHVAV